MNHILNIKKVALAVGMAAAVFYMGSALLMLIAGKEGTVKFYNALLHGMDTYNFIRMDVPITDSLLGVLLAIILGAVILDGKQKKMLS
jgi:multisubunit Na+/H+ antiporter MnhB subunit